MYLDSGLLVMNWAFTPGLAIASRFPVLKYFVFYNEWYNQA